MANDESQEKTSFSNSMDGCFGKSQLEYHNFSSFEILHFLDLIGDHESRLRSTLVFTQPTNKLLFMI